MSQHPLEGQTARKDYEEPSERPQRANTERDFRPGPTENISELPSVPRESHRFEKESVPTRSVDENPNDAIAPVQDTAARRHDQGLKDSASQAIISPDKDPAQRAEADRIADLFVRLERLERTNQVLRLGCLVAVAFLLAIGVSTFITEEIIVKQTLMESKQLTLVDNDGNARLFLRMFSKVPVLQIMDGNGKPRMSLGLRFDDTPFIDLSDKRGQTRATFEMTEADSPALRLFNAEGDVTFAIN